MPGKSLSKAASVRCWPCPAVGTSTGGRSGSSASMAGRPIAYNGRRATGVLPGASTCVATTIPTTASRSRSHSGPPLCPSRASPASTSSTIQGSATARGDATMVIAGWPLAHSAMTACPSRSGRKGAGFRTVGRGLGESEHSQVAEIRKRKLARRPRGTAVG